MLDFLPPSYMAHRADIKSGDLIEWQSMTPLGWLIRKFTGRDVNHTSLVCRPSEFSGYRDRRFLLEALQHGITPTLLSERLRRFQGRVYWVPLADRFDALREQTKEIAITAMCQYRPGYDYLSLMAQIAGRVSIEAERFFCSEWCQWVWSRAGIIPDQTEAVQPGGFDKFGVTLNRVLIYSTYRENRWTNSDEIWSS